MMVNGIVEGSRPGNAATPPTMVVAGDPDGNDPTAVRGTRTGGAGRSGRVWYLLGVGPLLVFTLLFVVVPLGSLFLYSLGRSTFVELSFGFHPQNYVDALSNDLYRSLLVRSLAMGTITAVVCVALAFPFTYAITLGRLRRHGEVMLLAVLISLFAAYVVRVYAWRSLLGNEGVLNKALGVFGLDPLQFLIYTRTSVVITLVNVLLPMAILPIYSALVQIDRQYIESAMDLGASKLEVMRLIVLPLAARGVNAGFAVCLFLAAGDYVTPQLIGGANAQMIGNIIQQQFGVAFNWPLGSSLAFLLMLGMTVVVGVWILLGRALGIKGEPR